jgi:7-dehydrocholesterol reductase
MARKTTWPASAAPDVAGSAPTRGLSLLHTTIAPAALMLLTPPVAGLVWFTDTKLDGSLVRLAHWMAAAGIGTVAADVWGPIVFGSPIAWAMIGVFAALSLALMRALPGRPSEGPITPAGAVPVYKVNGIGAFLTTIALFLLCSFPLGLFPPTLIYDHFGELIGALNLAAVALCFGLYVKGRWAPSGPDHGLSGNPIFDCYWGTELHPRLGGWDVKMFTNCRFGMMGWALILISCTSKQYAIYGYVSDSMAVAVALQLFYVAKFFWWEAGYVRSLDMAHDRAGFYLCWGCLVWLPAIYAAATLYLVNRPSHLGTPLATALLVVGGGAICLNYLADAQRQKVRRSDGSANVWGRAPIIIRAHYTTARGESGTNLLLASGWWGLARHFHYVLELVAAVAWTLPVLFDRALPWFYVAYLAVLLLHRAWRDDARCAAKYGADWEAYRARVPYRVIPGLI